MCGIMGYAGGRQALPVLLDGLSRLEYRGYDSAGVAILGTGGLSVDKCEGRLARLVEKVAGGIPGQVGVGHTRWATHGAPSDANSHPHQDCGGRIALVHNGIIENYYEIKQRLLRDGHHFTSETDTEVIAHLIEEQLNGVPGDLDTLAGAVRRATSGLRGAYALVVLWQGAPEGFVAVREDNPLIIGFGQGENYLASDIPALLPYTRQVTILENGDLAIVTPERVSVTTREGDQREPGRMQLDMAPEQAVLGGYRHFMEKEIFEQPLAIAEAMRGRLGTETLAELLPELHAAVGGRGAADTLRQVCLVACGTAYNAGLVGRALIESLAGIHARADIASEFRYGDPLVGPDDLIIAISQSGETTDTLGALRVGLGKGTRPLGVVNVVGSSVARETGNVLYTRAGPEIAVASTKAYTTQLVVLTLTAIELARMRGRMSDEETRAALRALGQLPVQAEQALGLAGEIEVYARELARSHDAFFIGRGLDYAVCLEAQLKLKEISYLHAEAYPAGELKHGTLALITDGTPVVGVVTQPAVAEKTVSNIREVVARGGDVTAFVREDLLEMVRPHVSRVFALPATLPWLQPVLAAIPLQLLAYYTAVARGADVDKPRNLAKSVTVE